METQNIRDSMAEIFLLPGVPCNVKVHRLENAGEETNILSETTTIRLTGHSCKATEMFIVNASPCQDVFHW